MGVGDRRRFKKLAGSEILIEIKEVGVIGLRILRMVARAV